MVPRPAMSIDNRYEATGLHRLLQHPVGLWTGLVEVYPGKNNGTVKGLANSKNVLNSHGPGALTYVVAGCYRQGLRVREKGKATLEGL